MRAGSGLIIVAVGLFLLYIAITDKYDVIAEAGRKLLDLDQTGAGANAGASLDQTTGAAATQIQQGAGAIISDALQNALNDKVTPADLQNRLGNGALFGGTVQGAV